MEKIFKIALCGDAGFGKPVLFGGQQQAVIANTRSFFNIGRVCCRLTDCPWHERYIRNFITSCAEADCTILVVDAVRGIQEQTFMQHRYCQLLDVPVLFVVANTDMVDGDIAVALADEISVAFATSEILLTSNGDNAFVKALEHRLEELALTCTDDDKWALFVQDNILTPGNRAVTGIETGKCDPSREVMVYPSALPCRISPAINRTFTCDRDVAISRSSVISNVELSVGSELHGHLVSFADALPVTLLFKIGTDAAYVKSLSPDMIVLRKQVTYADPAALRKLGYGILIDNSTKLTVGMFIIARENRIPNGGADSGRTSRELTNTMR